jgi:hypothetical protein
MLENKKRKIKLKMGREKEGFLNQVHHGGTEQPTAYFLFCLQRWLR